jgi:thiamine biosynthesis lipoprotein
MTTGTSGGSGGSGGSGSSGRSGTSGRSGNADSRVSPVGLPAFGGAIALAELPRRAFVEQVMGLPFSLHVRGPRALGRPVAEAVATLFADLRADEARFSPWQPRSQVSRIRRGELRLADADPRVTAVAELCRQAEARTDGAFSAWRPGPDGSRPPGDAAFDPTGLVKGWAAQDAFDRLLARLAEVGAHDALLVAGGDVAVHCSRTDTPDWSIGVEDPRDRRRILRALTLRVGAVATSGTAARGQHIVDPATGAPAASGLLSATVIGPDLTWADVYATAAFVGGREGADRIARLPGHAVVLVADEEAAPA